MRGTELDVTTTFTIVSIIASLNKPLKRFVDILDRYYEYEHAKKSLNSLLYLIPNKPNDAQNDSTLITGTIFVKNCTTEIEDEKSMQKALGKIFGDSIDIEKEVTKLMNNSEKLVSKGKKRTKKCNHFKSASDFTNIQRKVLNRKMNITIPRRSKVVITGNEDSGDLAFLLTLCGETYITEGFIKYRGKIVYQDEDDTTYLVGESLRDNILMGTVMIKNRYEKVLDCVGLNLKDFPGGDQIEILENAKNLSNSERRLMLLARSLYASGDIYLLVDFFGHDEPELEKKLYLKMVHQLLKYKTVIIKSDHEHILREADLILKFNKGKVKLYQSYVMFRASNIPNEENTISFCKTMNVNPQTGKFKLFKDKFGLKKLKSKEGIFDRAMLSDLKRK